MKVPGKITYRNFHIDFSLPYTEQEENLLEDLLQIEYPNHYLLDLGWYPEMDPDGRFKLVIVKDFDWLHPVFQEFSTTEAELRASLAEAEELLATLCGGKQA